MLEATSGGCGEALICSSPSCAVCHSDPVLLCRYILVYPQGCDVCNHLSLFLCVADYDKLLPGGAHATWFFLHAVLPADQAACYMTAGWSHFAQFTIAVVNKDPKKSKYSGAFMRMACMGMGTGFDGPWVGQGDLNKPGTTLILLQLVLVIGTLPVAICQNQMVL